VKVALITDTHFGARNDNRVIQKHINQFFDDTFFPYLKEHDIREIVHLGDLMDKRKSVSYLTLKYVRENFIEKITENAIQTHVIVGNHDAYYKNTNQVNSVNELYGETPYLHIYDTAKTVNLGDKLKVCFIPWLCAENEVASYIHMDKTDAEIAMGHLELTGFLMFKGSIATHGLDKDIFAKFDRVYSGHFHLKNDDGHIYYLGTPYELMWSDYGTDRGFHIFDLETQELEFIRNPNTLFTKIFYDEKKPLEDLSVYTDKFVRVVVAEKPTDPYRFNLYIDRLYEVNPAQLTVVENFEEYQEEQQIEGTEDTITILGNYIRGYRTDLDSAKLENMVRTLYTEALSVE
tara:strand:+ start:693 stop:1733 length:1041 start_codon:yes stop_codon:yes gene_type:complete